MQDAPDEGEVLIEQGPVEAELVAQAHDLLLARRRAAGGEQQHRRVARHQVQREENDGDDEEGEQRSSGLGHAGPLLVGAGTPYGDQTVRCPALAAATKCSPFKLVIVPSASYPMSAC